MGETRPVTRSTSSQPPRCPLPMGSGGFFRKTVIHPEGAPDHEQAVGNIVRRTEGEFFDPGINQQRTNFQSERLFVRCAGTREPLKL